MKEIDVEFKDGSVETYSFVENLYDLDWQSYKPIERTVKMNAVTDRNGDIQEIQINQDEFIVELQEAIAKAVLKDKNIELNNVKVSTIKELIMEYGEDMEELNLKLKKKESRVNQLIELWSKGHTPNIDDPMLRDAIKNYNMMETGFNISTDELTKYEVELVNLVKNAENKKKMKEQNKMQQRMQRGTK